MDFKKVSFPSFIPSYKKYFELAKEQSIAKFVSFNEYDSNLIFYDNEVAGFYKVVYRNDELNDREIYIALLEKFRGCGLAHFVIKTLCKNIFSNDLNCEAIHMSIDKDNLASIKMAESLGFKRNEDLEKELREYNDFRTLIYTLKSRLHNDFIAR